MVLGTTQVPPSKVDGGCAGSNKHTLDDLYRRSASTNNRTVTRVLLEATIAALWMLARVLGLKLHDELIDRC
jgi:hypothetical protein